MTVKKDDAQRKSHLFGVGFDRDDDLKRITRGEDFTLFGGSERTHGEMVEEVQAFLKAVDKYGRKLSDISREEYRDIVREVSRRPKSWFYLGGKD
jgi:hypothetical protein